MNGQAGRTYKLIGLTVAGGVLGVVVSQYLPLFGTVLRELAEPWSPARIEALPTHVALFAFAGAAIGLLLLVGRGGTKEPEIRDGKAWAFSPRQLTPHGILWSAVGVVVAEYAPIWGPYSVRPWSRDLLLGLLPHMVIFSALGLVVGAGFIELQRRQELAARGRWAIAKKDSSKR